MYKKENLKIAKNRQIYEKENEKFTRKQREKKQIYENKLGGYEVHLQDFFCGVRFVSF